MLDGGNTTREVWADKGYLDGERERRLGKAGWRLHIQRKGQPGKPLSECKERSNRRIAKFRARVEHMFAALEQMSGKILRSIGLARATLHQNWKARAYNLRYRCSLMEVGSRPF
ncbi:transposase [Burkholderia ubonensis]|uniref:transposase n=1 Tax=Burkholderia ubonensis TaxID=101571 RepID=UPI000A62CE99|nr:transposase [Burkholderia ubonensis]